MNCSECLEASYPICCDFEVDIGIADDDYWVWITDKFNNVYKREVTVFNGSFGISVEDFIEGLFTENNKYTLNISTSETVNTREEFTSGYSSYTCLVFDFYAMPTGQTANCLYCVKVKPIHLTAAQIRTGFSAQIAAIVPSAANKIVAIFAAQCVYTAGGTPFTSQTFSLNTVDGSLGSFSNINPQNPSAGGIFQGNSNGITTLAGKTVYVALDSDSVVGDGTAIVYIQYIEITS